MLRQSEAEVRDRPIREVWSDDERKKLLPLLDAGASDGDGDDTASRKAGRAAGSYQVRLVLGGEWKTFEVKRAALREPDGSPLGQVLVLED